MVLPTILYNFQCLSFIRYSDEKSELLKNTQLKYRSSYFLSGYCYLARGKILSMSSSLTVQKQRAKKGVSDSPGLVDFASGLVNSVLNLPDGQVKSLWRIKITEVL